MLFWHTSTYLFSDQKRKRIILEHQNNCGKTYAMPPHHEVNCKLGNSSFTLFSQSTISTENTTFPTARFPFIVSTCSYFACIMNSKCFVSPIYVQIYTFRSIQDLSIHVMMFEERLWNNFRRWTVIALDALIPECSFLYGWFTVPWKGYSSLHPGLSTSRFGIILKVNFRQFYKM